LKSLVNAKTGSLEALWLNNAKAPFDDKAVRQALGYALDRDAIVNKLFGAIGVKKASQSLEPGIISETDQNAFSDYKLDLDKVTSLMKGAGFAKGSDGIWAKGSARASFAINTTAGNQRRETTEQIVQSQLKAAGFEMTIDNQKAGDLFGQLLPKGQYEAGLYAQVLTTPEPGVCTLFCSKNNPDTHNGTGQNWTRTQLPADQDKNMEKVDSGLDQGQRTEAGKKAMKDLAAIATSIPLDPLPNIVLWSEKVSGPIGDNPVLGPFWNIDKWGVSS